MNYEEMSDFEINLRVAKKRSLLVNEKQAASLKIKSSSVLVNDIVQTFEFNPCNNPSDAWSIIMDNTISVIKNGHWWFCGIANLKEGMWEFDNTTTRDCVDFETYGENPLRAAMICFLKMEDAEKNQ